MANLKTRKVICSVCNGNGFSCDFAATGGLNEVELTWNKPFDPDPLDNEIILFVLCYYLISFIWYYSMLIV